MYHLGLKMPQIKIKFGTCLKNYNLQSLVGMRGLTLSGKHVGGFYRSNQIHEYNDTGFSMRTLYCSHDWCLSLHVRNGTGEKEGGGELVSVKWVDLQSSRKSKSGRSKRPGGKGANWADCVPNVCHGLILPVC